jgi:acetyl-CoA acetyltransferase
VRRRPKIFRHHHIVCSIMAERRSKRGVATLCLRGGNVVAMIVERD